MIIFSVMAIFVCAVFFVGTAIGKFSYDTSNTGDKVCICLYQFLALLVSISVLVNAI